MKQVKIHCMTNPVTMQDVANVLLAVGASPIMALDQKEAAEIARHSDALLLNTGVPDDGKWAAWESAGLAAVQSGRPVVLDPVGAGASHYRREGLSRLLQGVRPQLIRCNQAEAYALLGVKESVLNEQAPGMSEKRSGAESERNDADQVRKFCGEVCLQDGVDSSLKLGGAQSRALAAELAKRYGCAVLMSGEADVVSDGERTLLIGGGDVRIRKITGGGCMLSALCAWRLAAGEEGFLAAVHAGRLWRAASAVAGRRTDNCGGGIGTFHVYLFDAAAKGMAGSGISADPAMEDADAAEASVPFRAAASNAAAIYGDVI